MNTSMPSPSRWMTWGATEQIIGDSAQSEPTKPTKPGFEGFVGSVPSDSAKIRVTGEPPPEAETPNRTQVGVDSATAPERVMSWADWKAAALNRLFLEQGTGGQLGRITAETVRHGERQVNRVAHG
jgi:hypothetical protein